MLCGTRSCPWIPISVDTGHYSNERYDELIEQAKAERLLVEGDAGLAPMIFEGAAIGLVDEVLDEGLYEPGIALDVKLWRVS